MYLQGTDLETSKSFSDFNNVQNYHLFKHFWELSSNSKYIREEWLWYANKCAANYFYFFGNVKSGNIYLCLFLQSNMAYI